MLNYYYSSSIEEFLKKSTEEIIGTITIANQFDSTLQQNWAWEEEIQILKRSLEGLKGHIFFEFSIPRMGKRVDTLLIINNVVFVIEFKVGETHYHNYNIEQVWDYALDLKNFHKPSHHALVVPVLVATEAKHEYEIINTSHHNDNLTYPIKTNKHGLRNTLIEAISFFQESRGKLLGDDYAKGAYYPTPTIIEAAISLYNNHTVKEITRGDAGAKNLTLTTTEIMKLIEHSKSNQKKSICFITGIPGAGKTLVGLNVAIQRSNAGVGEHAVFLSGNYPLVSVLQEALARDKVAQAKMENKKISKKDALRRTSAFIQIIHKYRDTFIGNDNIPPEKIAIFDEAQRAWSKEQMKKFMCSKKGVSDFDYSEPEFLISTMNRHKGWAVIICLVGGGQEINVGEAGLPEWFSALRHRFSNWDVYISPELNDEEYKRNYSWDKMLEGLNVYKTKKLHLATSMRSFRTPDLPLFIKALLDVNIKEARRLILGIKDKYPILLTRDFNEAKKWVREQSKGTTRYGLLASSGSVRLKPEGIFVKNKISVENWFLNGKNDVRSSYYLEDVVTEFDIQGLELDYSIVAWDADFRFENDRWHYLNFSGTRWNNIQSMDRKIYLKNSYRVLLTRARQGVIIYIPKGCDLDDTRKCSFYDGTYNYLKKLGIHEI